MSTLQLSFESLADDVTERVAELGRALREAVLSTDVEKALARQTDGVLTALSAPPAGAPGASANTSPSRH